MVEAAGAEVHLAHPLGVKGFTYLRVKNDERDAADLADLLRMGRLPEAWIAPAEVRELRELTRYRQKRALRLSLEVICARRGLCDAKGRVVQGMEWSGGALFSCRGVTGAGGGEWAGSGSLARRPAGEVAVRGGRFRAGG